MRGAHFCGWKAPRGNLSKNKIIDYSILHSFYKSDKLFLKMIPRTAYIVSKRTSEGVVPICVFVLATFSGNLLIPNILNYLCNCGFIKDESVCITTVDEPIKPAYERYYFSNIASIEASGATISTALPTRPI